MPACRIRLQLRRVTGNPDLVVARRARLHHCVGQGSGCCWLEPVAALSCSLPFSHLLIPVPGWLLGRLSEAGLGFCPSVGARPPASVFAARLPGCLRVPLAPLDVSQLACSSPCV